MSNNCHVVLFVTVNCISVTTVTDHTTVTTKHWTLSGHLWTLWASGVDITECLESVGEASDLPCARAGEHARQKPGERKEGGGGWRGGERWGVIILGQAEADRVSGNT